MQPLAKTIAAACDKKQAVVSSVRKETKTVNPPKQYTEDTLLSAMETAGNEEFDDVTEKKGLGTPATRAGGMAWSQ